MELLKILLVLLLMTITTLIQKLVNSVVPEPYMDEIFHVPQTVSYCNGNFSHWDAMITTPPGTYMLALGTLRAFNYIGIPEQNCSLYWLRRFNIFITGINFLVVYNILSIKHKSFGRINLLLSAINLSTFPILYFFNFLFYTDIVSTLTVMVMHLLYLKKKYFLSSLAGAFSVTVRQTNIVWVFYHAVELLHNWELPSNKKSRDSSTESSMSAFKSYLMEMLYKCFDLYMWRHLLPYGLVGIGFIAFVFYNNGIVLGDKTAHEVTLNIPQIGYFTLVFGAFVSSFVLWDLKYLLVEARRYRWQLLFLIVLSCIPVWQNTVAHKYLLADNRHYSFYLWKKVFQSSYWNRYLLVPVYVLVWFYIYLKLKLPFLKFLFGIFFCTSAQLIPTFLLDFRYFILPYMFIRSSISNKRLFPALLEFVLYTIVNFIVMHRFLTLPFSWSNSSESQRFMW